ncbi:G-box binding factor [Sparganum proliferum]
MAPANALSMLKSEVSLLITTMKCSSRSNYRTSQEESRNSLLRNLKVLRKQLSEVSDIDDISPLTYLTPFLDVIRSETTTGPITGLALTSVEKFLAYGLLEASGGRKVHQQYYQYHQAIPAAQDIVGVAIETVAEAVIQARFIRSGLSSDEVVLMKIVHLLRTLLLVPAGYLLSNEMVFEILQNCLRICLEAKLSELLRRTAEQFLCSIVQLFFSRLPSLIAADALLEQRELPPACKTPRMFPKNHFALDEHKKDPETAPHSGDEQPAVPTERCEIPSQQDLDADIGGSVCSLKDHLVQQQQQQPMPEGLEAADAASEGAAVTFVRSPSEIGQEALECQSPADEAPPISKTPETDSSPSRAPDEVRRSPVALLDAGEPPAETDVTADTSTEDHHATTAPTSVGSRCCRPYTLRAVHDLFAVLTDLLNPEQHPEPIVQVSLSLLTVALETGADFIPRCPSIMQLVATDMTKYLMMLLYRERIQLFAHAVRVCFLLFEALRGHLKLQLEVYFQRLIAIISSESDRISYEHREIALEAVTQLFLLPGLAAEIYVNYDCDPYCSNLFEDITDMLTKNAYPMARLMSTHVLSLEALLAVINAIDAQCALSAGDGSLQAKSLAAEAEGSQPPTLPRSTFQKRLRPNRHWTDPALIPTQEQLNAIKIKKKVLMIGSDRFNIKPRDGIAYLQRHGLLSDPLDPLQMAAFLSENPRLDKRTIGEFLSVRKNSEILYAFVRHFNFGGTRIDEALRAYLEAFRIPGEAPLIQHLMEHFAEQWFRDNYSPFANADAAFTLSYAILMLNTDQHNPNSKRQNVPMTSQDFKKNLKGMNGGKDFEPELIEAIYQSIRNNEIVMPSEQTGAVRENYLWKCLVRRSEHASFTQFLHIPPGSFDADLFTMIWGPSVSALSFIFDKTTEVEVQAKAICGFVRCASIAAHYRMVDVFDNLTISLCKFTTLMSPLEYPEQLPVLFGRNRKAQLATRLVFALVSAHADILRDGWRSLVDCLLQLFRADLLSDDLVESVDYVAPGGQINLFIGRPRSLADSSGMVHSRSESGMLSSFYQYFSLGSTDKVETVSSPAPAPARPPAKAPSRSKTSGAVVDHVAAAAAATAPSREANVRSPLSTSSSAANLLRLIDQACSSDQLFEHQFPTLDEASALASARSTAENCQVAVLIEETKFMMDASLQELIKALLSGLYGEKYDLTSIDESPSGGHLEAEVEHPHSKSATLLADGMTTPPPPPPPPPAAIDPVPIDTVHRSLHALVTTFIPPQFLEPTSPSSGARKPTAATYFSNKPGSLNERSQAFCLELIVRILLFNRDRVGLLWPLVRGNLVEMLMVAREPCFLVERVITGLLHLALRLIRRQNLTVQIFACLYFIITHRGQFLLQPPGGDAAISHQRHQRHRPLSPVSAADFGRQSSGTGRAGGPGAALSTGGAEGAGETRSSVARQVVCGLATLLLENAAEFPSSSDWQLVFGLLEICGAGAFPICRGDSSDMRLPQGGLLDSQKRHGALYSSLQTVAVGESESLRGYSSDNEKDSQASGRPSAQPSHSILASLQQQTAASGGRGAGGSTQAESWVLVNVNCQEGSTKDDCKDSEGGTDAKAIRETSPSSSSPLVPSSALHLPIMIVFCDLFTLEKAVDSIAFLVRDPAHITPNSIEYCVHALRVFVEACSSPSKPPLFQRHGSDPNTSATARDDPITGGLALQLLDLVYTLFSRAPSIYAEWTKAPSETTTTTTTATEGEADQPQQPACSASENSRLWSVCWRSLLQSIARLCVDCRREVRSDALAFLQRALLSPILHVMTGEQWEDCFHQVLFPLLTNFLEIDFLDEARRMRGDLKTTNAGVGGHATHNTAGQTTGGGGGSGGGGGLGFFSGIFGALSEAPGSTAPVAEYADPRMRAIPLLTKIFLQHLKPLHGLETFPRIWMRILAYMEAYLRANISDSLNDAVRESLKNLLLVMYTGTQDTPPLLVREASTQTREGQLWCQTQHQLATFLPSLMDQLFPPPPTPAPPADAAAATTTTNPATAALPPPSSPLEEPSEIPSTSPPPPPPEVHASVVAAAPPSTSSSTPSSPPPIETPSLVPEVTPRTETTTTTTTTAITPTVIPGAVRISIPMDFDNEDMCKRTGLD